MKPKNIIIIEDEYIVAEDIKSILEDANYNVVDIVTTGEDALSVTEKKPIDFAFIDIKLPGKLDGIEIANILKNQKQIPFIYLTAYADDNTINRAKITEPYGYIVKPFSEEELISNLEMALHKYNKDINIRSENSYYYKIINSLGEGVIATDANDKIIFINDTAKTILGCKSINLTGKKIKDIYKVEKEYDNPNYKTLISKSGKKIYINEKVSFINDFPNINKNSQKIKIILFKDITKNKYEEEILKSKILGISAALENSKEKLHSLMKKYSQSEQRRLLISKIIDNVPDVSIVIFNSSGQIINYNRAFKKYFGLKKEEITNIDAIKQKIKSEKSYNKMRNAFLKGKTWLGNISLKIPGDKHKQLSILVLPIKNEYNEPTHFVALGKDITKEYLLERKLKESQKMEAIGALASGIAHDFNNILGIIIGYTDILISEVGKDSPFFEQLNQVYKAGERGKELVKQIFASISKEDELEPIELTPILKERVKLFRATFPKTIELNLIINAKEDIILANPILLHQVIMNLCINARQALKNNRGLIEITLENILINSDSRAYDLNPGKYVKLSIRDTGTGIPESILDKIFDPFFTTKTKHQGTGLGLTLTNGIIKKLGGKIAVSSIVNKGTTFEIILPIAKIHSLENPKQNRATNDLPVGKGKILFVDDEKELLNIWERILRKLGYEIEATSDSMKALNMFKQYKDSFDLVITDIDMPILNGIELAQQILKIKPDIPIIACSGYMPNAMEELNRMGILSFLNKPFTPEELAKSIKKALK